MHINVSLPEPQIDVILGSRSDLEYSGVREAIREFEPDPSQWKKRAKISVHIVSCHRNPEALRTYAENRSPDVIIAGAGMAAALPGVLKAWLSHYGKDIPVIGVAFPGKTAEANHAACLSIEQLPGQPVELSSDGTAYFGLAGLQAALRAAVDHEFLPRVIEKKPVEKHVDLYENVDLHGI